MTATQDWMPDRAQMLALADRYRDSFRTADPFPHVVIDDFLPDDVISGVIDAYPGPEDAAWGTFSNIREIKLALNDEAQMPPPIRHVIQQLNSQIMIEFLESLTGISGLVADPHLVGGGLHQIRPGGVLKIHADFDLHKRLKLHRRLNAILYLNQDWDESYGGALELWNLEMTAPVQRVYPNANRLVVFATTDTSWHGHPDPLSCPPDRTRRSLAWYYYTAVDDQTRTGHTTLFQARPGETIKTSVDRARDRLEPVKDLLRPVRDRLRSR